MNAEQKEYISLINRSDKDEILIKKTGWEEINLAGHAHHGKYQIIYTLSGTLHVQIGAENYFVPEKHIAWIPKGAEHHLSSKSRQVSLVIFFASLEVSANENFKEEFSIYMTNTIIAENLKFIASRGTSIIKSEQPDLYYFALGFFRLLPQIASGAGFLLKTMVIPNDSRLEPVLDYITEHFNEEIKMEVVAQMFNLSVRNLSRLFNMSGIHFSSYINHLRIVRAIELLTDGEKTVKEIAYDVGFSTPNNFNRVFKQITGLSPKAYLTSIS